MSLKDLTARIAKAEPAGGYPVKPVNYSADDKKEYEKDSNDIQLQNIKDPLEAQSKDGAVKPHPIEGAHTKDVSVPVATRALEPIGTASGRKLKKGHYDPLAHHPAQFQKDFPPAASERKPGIAKHVADGDSAMVDEHNQPIKNMKDLAEASSEPTEGRSPIDALNHHALSNMNKEDPLIQEIDRAHMEECGYCQRRGSASCPHCGASGDDINHGSGGQHTCQACGYKFGPEGAVSKSDQTANHMIELRGRIEKGRGGAIGGALAGAALGGLPGAVIGGIGGHMLQESNKPGGTMHAFRMGGRPARLDRAYNAGAKFQEQGGVKGALKRTFGGGDKEGGAAAPPPKAPPPSPPPSQPQKSPQPSSQPSSQPQPDVQHQASTSQGSGKLPYVPKDKAAHGDYQSAQYIMGRHGKEIAARLGHKEEPQSDYAGRAATPSSSTSPAAKASVEGKPVKSQHSNDDLRHLITGLIKPAAKQMEEKKPAAAPAAKPKEEPKVRIEEPAKNDIETAKKGVKSFKGSGAVTAKLTAKPPHPELKDVVADLKSKPVEAAAEAKPKPSTLEEAKKLAAETEAKEKAGKPGHISELLA